MTVALVGLTSIQFYWVQSAMEIKEQQFGENVGRALNTVVYNIEKVEAANYIKNHNLNGEVPADMSSLLIDMAAPGDSCCFKLSEEASQKSGVSEYITAEGKHIKRNRREILKQCFKDRKNEKFKKGNIFPTSTSQKTSMVSEIINDLMNMQNLRVEDRIDPEIVRLLLEGEFQRMNISTEMNFGVVSQMNGVLLKEREASDKKLLESPYKIKMFPGEFSMYPNYLSVYFPREKGFLLQSMGGVMAISILFIGTIIFVFWYSLNVILKQKKLAIVKNDFINNMTHELKTPISTISLACEVLKDRDIPKSEERLGHYVDVINEENKRLGVLVENVLQSAVWDRPDFKLNKTELDVHEIILSIASRFDVQVDAREGRIDVDFGANDPFVEADKVHFTNAISNLVDNAIKYSKDKPLIQISTKNVESGIAISVTDNGIGIGKEEQKKIFEKLYRVHTGNLHDVKGFGLGLSYVKAIVDQHQGEIQVKSQLGEGSTFILFIPKTQNDEHRKN
jgi:two-component system phosphate regulon sensor histidine kinase PhoR